MHCPTEEILLHDGWKEYVAPFNELAEEQILVQEKESKILDITEYDSSNYVNMFYVNNIPMWLDKATRAGLVGRLTTELKKGKNITTLWYDTHKFELSTELAMDLLNTLEIYASECYDNTHQHIVNVNSIDNIEDVKAYDFKTGYPKILYFEF